MVSFPMGDGMEISAIRELKDGKLHTVGEIREREVHGNLVKVGQLDNGRVGKYRGWQRNIALQGGG